VADRVGLLGIVVEFQHALMPSRIAERRADNRCVFVLTFESEYGTKPTRLRDAVRIDRHRRHHLDISV